MKMARLSVRTLVLPISSGLVGLLQLAFVKTTADTISHPFVASFWAIGLRPLVFA
jgi:hypothetical protein